MDLNTDNSNNTKNNHKEFFSLLSLRSITDKFKADPKKILQKQLTKTAQDLLSDNNYKAFFDMMEHGYVPNPKQQVIVNEYIENIFSRPCNDPTEFPHGNDLYLILEERIKNGFKLNYNNVFSFLHKNFLTYKVLHSALENSERFLYDENYTLQVCYKQRNNDRLYELFIQPLPHLSKELRSIIYTDEFSNALYNEFLDSFKIKVTGSNGRISTGAAVVSRYQYILENAPELIFKNVPAEEFLNISKFLQHQPETYYNTTHVMKEVYNKLYSNHFKDILKDTNLVYSNEQVKNLTIDSIKSQLTDNKDIPANALEVIEIVEKFYNKIKVHPELRNHTDEMSHLEIILEKRIPEVLSKFLTIDPDYRTSLVNTAGKNAEQLMLDSLNNLKQSFTTVYENMNQNSVNDLSANNRYTKSIKM